MAPACWLCGSVCGGGGFRKGTMASACLSVWEKESSSSCLDARHFSSSLYATGAFQAATLVWCRSSEGVSLSKSMCGFFKGNCLGLQKFLPLTQSPLVLQPEIMGTYLLGTGTLGRGAWCGAGTPHC